MDLDLPDDTIGLSAVQEVKRHGPKRHQLGIVLEGNSPAPLGFAWELLEVDGKKIGDMTNCIWSPRLKANIGYALVSVEAEVGSIATVIRPNGPTEGQLVELPFL